MAMTKETVQSLYTTNILKFLGDMKDSGLKKLAQRKTAKGGESVTFYRIGRGKTREGVPSMYDNDGVFQDGGDLSQYKAYIKKFSSQQKLEDEEIQKTGLDIKSSIIETMALAVALSEDDVILKEIEKDGTYTPAGGPALDPSEMSTVRALAAIISRLLAASLLTPGRGEKGVGLVMNEEDYSRLVTSEAFMNSDYAKFIEGGHGGVPLKFKGAEIMISPLLESGTAYIIPPNVIGYAEWENGIKPVAKYHDTDGERWHLQITKSYGVKVIEGKKIYKFQMKPATGPLKKGK